MYKLSELPYIEPAEWDRLSDKELKKAVASYAGRLNKRLASMERSGLTVYSPAYRRVAEEVRGARGATRFTSALNTRAELEQELNRMSKFQESKTSYTRSARQQKKIIGEILGHYGEGISGQTAIDAVQAFWHDFHRFQEANPAYKYDSDGLLQYYRKNYYKEGGLQGLVEQFHIDEQNDNIGMEPHVYSRPIDLFSLGN